MTQAGRGRARSTRPTHSWCRAEPARSRWPAHVQEDLRASPPTGRRDGGHPRLGAVPRVRRGRVLGVSVEEVTALVLGGHGDTMVPLVRYATVAGIPISRPISTAKPSSAWSSARDAGAEVVALLKTGSAPTCSPAAFGDGRWWSRSSATRSAWSRAARYSRGEYGVSGLYVGVPVIIGEGRRGARARSGAGRRRAPSSSTARGTRC